MLVCNALNKKWPGCEADTNDHKTKEGSYHSPAANPEDAEEPDFFVKITLQTALQKLGQDVFFFKSRLLTLILLVLVMDNYGLKSDFDVYYNQLYFTMLVLPIHQFDPTLA